MKTARKYVVSGRVQGVGFRFFAERWANRLGLSGYVKNCADGSVEAYAIGTDSALKAFQEHLADGPASACVEHVEVYPEVVNSRYKRFVIESDW